jgi:hypothetical protein
MRQQLGRHHLQREAQHERAGEVIARSIRHSILCLLALLLVAQTARADEVPGAVIKGMFSEMSSDDAGPDSVYSVVSIAYSYTSAGANSPQLSGSALQSILEFCANQKRTFDSSERTQLSCVVDTALRSVDYTFSAATTVRMTPTADLADCDSVREDSASVWIWTRDSHGECSEGTQRKMSSPGIWTSTSNTNRVAWNADRVDLIVYTADAETLQVMKFWSSSSTHYPDSLSVHMGSISSTARYTWANDHMVGSTSASADSNGLSSSRMSTRIVRGVASNKSHPPSALPFSVRTFGSGALFTNGTVRTTQVRILRADGTSAASLVLAGGATARWAPSGPGVYLWTARDGRSIRSGKFSTTASSR